MQHQDPNAGSSSEPRQRNRRRQRPPHRARLFLPPQLQAVPPQVYEDDNYFKCYSDFGVHEELINDKVRTDTYENAIRYHEPNIAGKVVLDVGCGTGMLSVFCARAGAKKVYAVEAAADIVQLVTTIVEANNYSDVISIIEGRIEDVDIPEQVDVIVSEWMGNMLLCENMLSSVIIARERFLKRGGVILPSSATLFVAPINYAEPYSQSVDFWRNVHGIDMSAAMPFAKQNALQHPYVESIKYENLMTLPIVVKHINCHTITIPELAFVEETFRTRTLKKGRINGFAFWFDVEFSTPNASSPSSSDSPNNAPVLSTGPWPDNPETHWGQTVIYFSDPLRVESGQHIDGSVTLKQCPGNQRFIDVGIQLRSGDTILEKKCVVGWSRLLTLPIILL